MPLEIGQSIENGLERTQTRKAAIFAGLYFLVNILTEIFVHTMFENVFNELKTLPQTPGLGQMSVAQMAPLSLGASKTVTFLGLAVSGLLALILNIGVIRGLLDGKDQFKKEYFTENFLWTLGNIIAGGVIFSVIWTIGTVFLIIPGIFLFVSLLLWSIYVIDRNINFIEGMKLAWEDIKGSRIQLFAVLLIISLGGGLFDTITGGILNLIASSLTGLFLGPSQISAVGSIVSLIPTGFVTVFGFAVLIDVYEQISTVEG